MPLMGLEELPSKPLMRPATVTKRKPKTTTKTAAKKILVPAGGGTFDRVEGEQHPHHGDDDDGADHHSAHGNVAIDSIGRTRLAGAFGANVLQSCAQLGGKAACRLVGAA